MAQNQKVMQEYDERYRQVIVEGLGLPMDPQAQNKNTLSVPPKANEQNVPPSTSQLELQNRLTLINEEGDDDQSSTDNQNAGRNRKHPRVRADNGAPDQQVEGASVNYDSSPMTVTDVDGANTREYG